MQRSRLPVCLLLGMILLATVALAREWKDATGAFRVEAELVAVRDGKVYLEKPNGAVITVALEKLSQADQDFLKKGTAPAVPAKPPAADPVPGTPAASLPTDKQELARRALGVLQANCYRCHGHEGSNEGGFNYILSLEKLSQGYVKAGNPAGSPLYERMTAASDSRMPPEGENPRPSAADITLVKRWIEVGAPALAQSTARTFFSNADIMGLVAKDLEAAPERSRKYYRYFTLSNLYNSGVSEDELQTYRLALSKLVNSLSWNPTLVKPQPIDPARTILRVDIRELNWTLDNWQDIARSNPYGLKFDTVDAKTCYQHAQTEMPAVRADWFVFAASRPPLYHTLLGLPETDLELEQNLRVNVASNIEQEKVARAAFNRSGVSQNNRLIERHALPQGSYWKSYDFGGNVGAQSLFQHPLGPGGNDGFRHDGGEIVFSLPNGLQGYLLVDKDGKRIDKGPTEIVSDPRRPDKLVTNGVSCMSCHYAGIITKADEIRPFVEVNRKSFKEVESILAIYPDKSQLDRFYDEDGRRFANAMKQIGFSTLSRTGEPISSMAQRFEEELDLARTASEFGLTPDEFSSRLDESELGRELGSLKVSGGTIKRDVFVQMFGRVALEFKLVADFRGLASRGVPPAKIKAPEDAVGEIRRFKDTGLTIQAMAFSADGGRLMAGGIGQMVIPFDIDSAKMNKEGALKTDYASFMTFTPDGDKLLVGQTNGRIEVFSVERGGTFKPAGSFAMHGDDVRSIACSPDGRFVLSSGKDKKALYWSIDDRRLVHSFDGVGSGESTVWISADGKLGVAADGENMQFLDLVLGKVKRAAKTVNWSVAQRVAISPDASKLAISKGSEVVIIDTQSGKQFVIKERDMQWTCAFTADSNFILTGMNGVVNMFDARNGKKIDSFAIGKSAYVQTLVISPDGRHAAAAMNYEIVILRLPKTP